MPPHKLNILPIPPNRDIVSTGDESAPPHMAYTYAQPQVCPYICHSPIVPLIAQIHNESTGTHKLNLLATPPNRVICNGEATCVMNLHHQTCPSKHMLNHMYAPPYICTPPGYFLE